jgi:hypothetical protein
MLIEGVASDFPHASEILLEFPDEWRITTYLECDPPLYIGGWTYEERARSDRFRTLALIERELERDPRLPSPTASSVGLVPQVA